MVWDVGAVTRRPQDPLYEGVKSRRLLGGVILKIIHPPKSKISTLSERGSNIAGEHGSPLRYR